MDEVFSRVKRGPSGGVKMVEHFDSFGYVTGLRILVRMEVMVGGRLVIGHNTHLSEQVSSTILNDIIYI